MIDSQIIESEFTGLDVRTESAKWGADIDRRTSLSIYTRGRIADDATLEGLLPTSDHWSSSRRLDILKTEFRFEELSLPIRPRDLNNRKRS